MTKSCSQSRILFFLFFASSIILLLFYQIGSFQTPFIYLSTPNSFSIGTQPDQLLSKLRDSITFFPLKDLKFEAPPITFMQQSWFLSTINDTVLPNQPKHIYFPSPKSKNRLLCISAHNQSDATRNFYALAFPDALPHNATLLRGLTFVSDSFYIYDNIWHGMQAVTPFVAWHEANNCARPERWALFRRGALRTADAMSNWVHTMASASIGNEVRIEEFDGYNDGPVCFEKAVVCRLNDQGLTVERKGEVFDMIRCKVREHCGVVRKAEDLKRIRMTLLLRVGARAFKNETVVTEIFQSGCRKFDGCEFKVAVSNNLTFCDQVKLMAETDIIVTSHGAQLTNMIFMDRNSSILEIFPEGWREYGGTGMHVYEWLAHWSGMTHQGQWTELTTVKCPYDKVMDCFYYFKNGKVGHDEVYFANWTATVLEKVKDYKSSPSFLNSIEEQARLRPCPCN